MLEFVIRAVAMYLIALIVIRIMGKRALGELGLFDFVVMTGVGHILTSVALDQSLPFYEGVVVLITLAFMEYFVGYISLKNQKLAHMITGSPVVMIENGKIIRENLGKEKFNVDDLLQELRKQGVRDISEVETGILEPSGGFSVILKAGAEPVTREDLGIDWQPHADSILTYKTARREDVFSPGGYPERSQESALYLAQAIHELQTKMDEISARLDMIQQQGRDQS